MKMEKPLLNTRKTENVSVYAEVFLKSRNSTGGHAFFSIEFECHSEKIQLNGQMTAKPGYKWSDNIEPTLITILQGIRIKT